MIQKIVIHEDDKNMVCIWARNYRIFSHTEEK